MAIDTFVAAPHRNLTTWQLRVTLLRPAGSDRQLRDDGAGNWPFNTAYAARYGLDAFVTRLRSLTEAEQFIKAGIPLVASVSFKESKLDGAGYAPTGTCW